MHIPRHELMNDLRSKAIEELRGGFPFKIILQSPCVSNTEINVPGNWIILSIQGHYSRVTVQYVFSCENMPDPWTKATC